MVPTQLCRDALETLGAPIQIVYGQTETSPVLTQAWHADTEEDLTQTIGQPVAYTEISIRDPQSNAVIPIGEQGEICARAYSVMLGYNDNPDATAATIDREGWLHTGDLGRMDARSYEKITGRVFVRERLSPQKTPAFWIQVQDWPLTGSGKIRKFKLAEEFEAGQHTPMA